MRNMTKKYTIAASEDSLKNKIVFFKNNFSEKLKITVLENKMLLSYDDRTNAFYIFSNFLTQYGIYLTPQEQNTTLTVFEVSKGTAPEAKEFLQEFITYLGIGAEEESSQI